MEFSFLGRQPILNRDEEIVFYSLLFRRNNSRKLPLKDIIEGDASVLSELMHSFGLQKTLEGKKAFLKVDDQTIIKTDLSILPKEHIIFELTDRSSYSAKVAKEINRLMSLGFEFAISHLFIDDVLLKNDESFLEKFKYIMFNVRKLDFEVYYKHERLLKKLGIKLIATKVETQQGFDMCKRLGFDYFLGFFFAEPKILKGNKFTANQGHLLKLLEKIRNGVENEELINDIRSFPDIALMLLKFINSAKFTHKKEIDTITQAINLLGSEKLMAWVALTLFSANNEKHNFTLIETSLMRAKKMELLCPILKVPKLAQEAYLVGLLSLSDTIFKIPMRDIVENSFFSDDVSRALLEGEGELGKVLKVAIIMEKGDFRKIEFIANKLNLRIEELSNLLQECFSYVNNIRKLY